ncbi:MAG: hypothetical protein M1816_006740 [Peltula sp. TS41687]|nr:MAG: hypothetical protein M1816_006740 [Peltula sp. TS41687]
MPSENPNATTHLSDLNPLKGLLRTPGVQNVEKAFSRGGAAPNQKLGAGTNTASADDVEPRQDKVQGVGAETFQRDIGGQKPQWRGVTRAKAIEECKTPKDPWFTNSYRSASVRFPDLAILILDVGLMNVSKRDGDMLRWILVTVS